MTDYERRKKAWNCEHHNRVVFADGVCGSCYAKAHGRSKASKCEHVDKTARAKGLCYSCYNKKYPKTKMAWACEHTDKPHSAHGQCETCYKREQRPKNPRKADCHPDRPHARNGFCMQCAGKEKRLERRYAQYGLSLNEALLLLYSQGNACQICRKELDLIEATVDHDHDTNVVRGLLCGPCNAGLGLFHDSVEDLRSAIIYLDERKGVGTPKLSLEDSEGNMHLIPQVVSK